MGGVRRGFVVALVVGLLVAGLASVASGARPSRLYSFGKNHYGQLGNSTNNNTDNPNPTPTAASLPSGSGQVIQLAAGYAHSLALTSTGRLYAFGYNGNGELGNSTNNGTLNPNPTPTRVSLPGASGRISQIAAGDSHSLVLTSTGQLYAFGYNYFGELGNSTNSGTSNPNPTPTLVSLPGASGRISQIAAGGGHSLAATSTGQLYAFGNNYYGQLGNSTNNGTGNPNPTPTLVSLPGASGRIIQLAAGDGHSLAVTSTGQLYAFGYNHEGELGNSTNSNTFNPNPTPTLVSLPGASGRIIQIAAGGYHSLVLTSTGRLSAFGANDYGQLGNSTNSGTTNPNPTPTLVSLPGASGRIIQIAAGASHSLALTSTGRLYAFGYNGYGQLGSSANSGTYSPNPTPTQVMLAIPRGMGIAAISHGSEAQHTLVALGTPTVSSLRVSPGRRSVSGRVFNGHCVKTTAKNRGRKHCTRAVKLKITYTLTMPATVKFTFSRQTPGRKVGKRCVKPTAKNRKHKHCTHLSVVRGSITQTGSSGANTLTFTTRLHGRTLTPVTYRLTATPTINAGNGTPQSTTFRLVG